MVHAGEARRVILSGALKLQFMHMFRLWWISTATLVFVVAALSLATPQNSTKTPPTNLLPKTGPEAAFAAPLPGNKTDGANQVLEVLGWLGKYEQGGRKPANKINFVLPESVVNEYLAYALRINPRPGLSSVTLKLLPNNEISSLVWIDFDAIAKWNPRLLPSPLRPFLNGKKAVQVDALLDARDGSLNYTLKTAYGPAGDLIAKKVMDEIIQVIGQHQRELYNIGKHPVPLPFGLKRMWCEKQLLLGET